MKKLVVLLALTWAAFAAGEALFAADEAGRQRSGTARADLSGFPVLSGKVETAAGHFSTFGPPRSGDSFRLDLKEALSLTKIDFDPTRRSYIPLASPLEIASVKYSATGAFASMRLVSRQRGRSLTLDVLPIPGLGSDHVRVWVTCESEVLEGVVMIECRSEGDFPARSE